MNLFNSNFNPMINPKRFFHFGMAAGLLTFSACGQANSLGMLQSSDEEQASPSPSSSSEQRLDKQKQVSEMPRNHERKQIYIVPGLGCSSDSPELLKLAADLKQTITHVDGVHPNSIEVYIVPMQINSSIASREEIIVKYIMAQGGLEKSTSVFLVGHSFGGLLSITVAEKLRDRQATVAGVFTINSPMDGIKLDVEDPVSSLIVQQVTQSLDVDKNALNNGSDYLKKIRSVVEHSDFPILSIGSSCQPSDQFKGIVEQSELTKALFAPLMINLSKTDMVIKQDSQIAVKDFRTNKHNLGVCVFDNCAHDSGSKVLDLESYKFVLELLGVQVPANRIYSTDAPFILQLENVSLLVSAFVVDPVLMAESCRSND